MTQLSLPPLKKTIKTYGLAARKGLGQHFLLDLNLTQKIVSQAGDLRGVTVCEIGPGPGGLTRPLVESKAEKIIAIEKDARCVLALSELAEIADGRLEIIEADALKADLAELAPAPRAIISNLPYNVGSALLVKWLAEMHHYQSLTLMFQAEVADRILAVPRTKEYGRLSVISQFVCVGKRVMNLPAKAFTPPPKVDSAVVHLTPRPDRPQDVEFKKMEMVTAAAFGQRRKMLRASLKPLGGQALLEKAGIDPTRRAEELTIAEFEDLARVI